MKCRSDYVLFFVSFFVVAFHSRCRFWRIKMMHCWQRAENTRTHARMELRGSLRRTTDAMPFISICRGDTRSRFDPKRLLWTKKARLPSDGRRHRCLPPRSDQESERSRLVFTFTLLSQCLVHMWPSRLWGCYYAQRYCVAHTFYSPETGSKQIIIEKLNLINSESNNCVTFFYIIVFITRTLLSIPYIIKVAHWLPEFNLTFFHRILRLHVEYLSNCQLYEIIINYDGVCLKKEDNV